MPQRFKNDLEFKELRKKILEELDGQKNLFNESMKNKSLDNAFGV